MTSTVMIDGANRAVELSPSVSLTRRLDLPCRGGDQATGVDEARRLRAYDGILILKDAPGRFSVVDLDPHFDQPSRENGNRRQPRGAVGAVRVVIRGDGVRVREIVQVEHRLHREAPGLERA